MSSGETDWEAEPISCFLQEGNLCAWDVQDLWHTLACNPGLSDWHTGMAGRNMGVTLPDTTQHVREGESEELQNLIAKGTTARTDGVQRK